jgi:hypothetical protein
MSRLICFQHPGIDLAGPEKMKENIDHIESMPFDGVVMNIPDVSGHAMGKGRRLNGDVSVSSSIMMGTSISYDFICSRLKPLDGAFKKYTHNFACIFTDRPQDFFDDWNIQIDNWRNMARAIKEFGFRGIFFDNEEYLRKIWRYPDTCDYKEKTLEEYQDQTTRVGRQIMEAVVESTRISLFL